MRKLQLNYELFLDALKALPSEKFLKYKKIGANLKAACDWYAPLFEARHRNGHIMRCHGDLKTTNLWVQYTLPFLKKRVLALDCIDFKPEFCYIDTLSDVAMLLVDLERLHGSQMADDFLRVYLHEMNEKREQVKPLLEYYITEKAMVCAYVSILYDTHQIELGKRYLKIASRHAQELRLLMEKAKERKKHVRRPRASHSQKALPVYSS